MLVEDQEFDFFVASKIGSFKHVKFHTTKEKNSKKCIENLQDIKSLEKDDSITCLQWANKDETEILIARRNQQIQTFSTSKKCFTSSIVADYGKGNVVGVGKTDNKLLTAVECGIVRLWSKKGEHIDLNTGADLDKMKLSSDDETLFVTGGKENDVKLWKVGEDKPLFHAKNLPQDWLQLRQPVWVSDCCIMPRTDGKVLAACSRYGYVRLYDTRAQRRPVCNVAFEKMPAVCMTPAFDERMVLVGFGRGQMHQIDLRTPKGHIDKGYKGSIGAVTDIALIRGTRYIVSTSLDRHLKVHNADTKELIYKQYMTSKLSGVLVQTESSTPLSIKIEEEKVVDTVDVDLDAGDGSDGIDDLFDNMETVGDKSKKRKPDADVSSENVDDSIRKLLRSTEKKKRKLVKEKSKKKQKSVFHKA